MYFNQYGVKPPEAYKPSRIGRAYNAATKELPHLAYTAADTYLDRKHAHEEADILSQTDTSKMRWTGDGRLARTGAFGLRKALALRKIWDTIKQDLKPKTVNTRPVRIKGPGGGQTVQGRMTTYPTNWHKNAVLGRLAFMAANVLYQGWTRKRAQFNDSELDDLAAYNHHNGITDDVKELQAAIKRNADIRAGVRVAGDGILDKLGGPNADAAHHGTGMWQEFADMRHRYKLANAYDKVRARVKEWRHANPNLKAPQAGMSGGMGDIMGMLGGMGGEGGMGPEEMQQMQQMIQQMGGGDPNGGGGMDMQKMMQMMEQMGGHQGGSPQRGMNPRDNSFEKDQFDEEADAAFWRAQEGSAATEA